jgi:non-specific serine/threonine protein kinase
MEEVGRHHHNLPTPLSEFIGREREIAEVNDRLAVHRLLTLTGPGGSGKTRLALRAAGELLTEFAEGVWLTEFAPLADAALTPQAVASTLGIREQPGRSLTQTLTDHLHRGNVLLVFDNCEHLVAACAQLAETLLSACPGLRILATSREPLGIPGEAVWVVPPLTLPDPHPWRDPASGHDALPAYQQSEAVRLFVARAASATPAFSLTTENGAWVAEVCRRLDGMPLAIELAAARVRALSIQQIAERLDDRFHLLTAGSRTAPPRHQTLAATLDWSYALLSDSERKVLQRLSVFAGGCTLEAAEAVCVSEGVETNQVLDVLSHLVDKSLVVVDKSDGETRYRLLETIRQYAYQKLFESGYADQTRDRHLDYFLHWAEKAEPQLIGPEQLLWLNRFETEHDNLRAALEYGTSSEIPAEAGLRLAAAAGNFWRLHGYHSEGRMRLSAALAHKGADQPTLTRARALHRACILAFFQTDYSAVRELAQESWDISRRQGIAGRLEVANALEILAEVASETGDYATGLELYEEALGLYKELGDLVGVGDTLKMLGWSAMRTGDYVQAESRLEEALVVCRHAGDLGHIASALAGLGELAIRRGQYERASNLLKESLSVYRSLGKKWGIAIALGSLGWLALRHHDFGEMRRLIDESLEVRMETGDRGGIAWCLEKLAEAAIIQGQTASASIRLERFQTAARAFGTAAAAMRAPVKSVIDPADQPEYERNLAALHAALGEEGFAAAWAEGSAMAVDQAIEYALAEPDLPEASLDSAQAAKEKFGGLTERERQVAALIAQGKSNREIANEMTVGVKTVETYVTRILNKLGFDSRVQIATWAVERGLAPPSRAPDA